VRQRRIPYLWALLPLMVGAAHGGDAVYKFVGPDGKVIYSQTPPADGKLDKMMAFEHLPATPLPAHVLAFRAEMERSIAQKVAQANAPPPDRLRLFSARWCGYCRQAQAWLAAQKVPYQNMDIDTPEGMSEFVLTGKGSVPLLLGPGIKVRGFSVPAYSAALAKPGK
jgi:glutaredoxin